MSNAITTFMICLLILLCSLILGASIGVYQAGKDCRLMGKFHSGEHVYSCSEEGR